MYYFRDLHALRPPPDFPFESSTRFHSHAPFSTPRLLLLKPQTQDTTPSSSRRCSGHTTLRSTVLTSAPSTLLTLPSPSTGLLAALFTTLFAFNTTHIVLLPTSPQLLPSRSNHHTFYSIIPPTRSSNTTLSHYCTNVALTRYPTRAGLAILTPRCPLTAVYTHHLSAK